MTSFHSDWRRIVALADRPVLRNLLITQGYHELSRDFARMLGPENVTWFGFASWSSKSVGGFLQGAPLPSPLRRRLEAASSDYTRQAPFSAAIRDVRRYLSKGNTEVFAELAPVFGRFIAWFETDRAPDHAKLERFVDTLEHGASIPDQVALNASTRDLELVGRGGQTLLREAVRHYYQAKFEPSAKRKAERILLANAHVGVHEQTRLQTYIAGALQLPLRVTRFERDAPEDLTRGPSWFSSQAQVMFRRLATEHLLTLKFPDGRVRLGRDLCAAPGQPLFPRILDQIEHPELGALFEHTRGGARRELELVPRRPRRLGQRPRSALTIARGTAADDWTSLDQRMRFILELFRSRQRNQRLLEPTFSERQVETLRSGRVPEGPLT